MFQIGQETQRLRPELTAKGRAPISLSMGAPVQAPPEFVINAMKEVLDEKGIHSYSSPKGEMFFLEAVAERMKNRFGVELDSKTEVFSLIGSKEGLSNMFKVIINPAYDDFEKDIILIPDPGYASYKEQIKVSGALPYPISLRADNNYMPDLNEVYASLKADGYDVSKVKAIVINYPNNPLGFGASREYLQQVVDFCREKKVLLISDAAYVDMYFDENEKPASILEFEGAKDVAIEFHSFSKPYAMTGWRVGWVCGNRDFVQALGKFKSTVDTGIFKAVQKAAAKVLNSKEGDEYIKESNKAFKAKQKIMIDGFRELGWDVDNLRLPNATFYLWLPVPPRYKKASDFTNELLHKSGVVIVPGNAFGTYGEGYFRLSFVASDDDLKQVFVRMKEDGFYFNK
jgi:LL-diaminopimelate aminotransferase